MTSKNYEKTQKKLIKKLEKFHTELELEVEKHKSPSGVRMVTEEYCKFYNLQMDVAKLLRTLKGDPEPKNYRDRQRMLSLKAAIEEETKKSLDKNKVVLG